MARTAIDRATTFDVSTEAETSVWIELRAIATPTEPETPGPVPFPLARATATAPASAVTTELSVALTTTFPLEAVALPRVTAAEIVCTIVLSTPTPAPAKEPVVPLLWPPLAYDPEPPAASV